MASPAEALLSISETFVSRQGEGKLTGVDSFFIRINGCNLRCWFCDTPYASWNPSGSQCSVADLLREAESSTHRHVVITGGEPLLAKAYESLVRTLQASGFHVTIETAGTLDKPLGCDLLSLSPKLSDSTPDPDEHAKWSIRHEQRRLPLETMKRLIEAAVDYQLKFVVSKTSPRDEILGVVDGLDVPPENVFLMPQGTTIQEMKEATTWLIPLCDQTGFQYCDRMQIHWFGNRRGT
ncbi:MAG: 7-carboxy-7-deazaguanine synthase QueE [Planctomycetota bacterium]